MEAIKRQASKFREQVSKQQQVLLRQLGHFDAEALIADEAEIARHHQLGDLYTSTRAAKHFEKDMIHGVEGFISLNLKQIEIDRRFARDCCRYEAENHCSTSLLAEAASQVGASRSLMIKETETFLGVFDQQVSKTLKALVKSAELEDARLLIRQYDRLWLEVEAQAAEVLRLRSKPTEKTKSGENSTKLQLGEEKLDGLKSRLKAVGNEATSAMQSVEAQQQQMTFQQLVVMVTAERSFHRNVLTILEKLLTEMLRIEQLSDSSPQADTFPSHMLESSENASSSENKEQRVEKGDNTCFVAKVIHPFEAQAETELNLSLDDTVVVQEMIPSGWSKGECNGKTGWFPSPYVERLDETAAGKMINILQ